MSNGKARDGVTEQQASDREGPKLTLGVVTLVCFALSVVYFFPAFLPGRHIYGSDYLAAGYFFQEFISHRLAAGVLPKWVPYVYGGLPLFSNPGSTFYPFRFLADLLFAPQRILPTLFVIQFTLAGVGMYLLTRELEVRRWIAMVAALAFQFTGLMMSYVLAGHDGRVIVATFTPLVFFFLHRGIRTGSLAAFVGAAATIGFALLSFQIQSAYYLLLAAALWALFSLIHLKVHRDRSALVRRVTLGLLAVAFAFAMAAVNFLPFLGYVDASPRGGIGGRGYAWSTSWAMPPAEITGLALPERAGMLENYQGENPFKLHTEYVGAVVILLLALGAGFSRKDRRWWFFLGLSVFALSISFGGHTPIYRLYYSLLPGTDKFRAPSVSLFLVSASLVAMAALTLERMAAARDSRESRKPQSDAENATWRGVGRWIAAGVAGLALIALIAATGGNDGSAHDLALVRGAFRWALFTWAAAGVLWAWMERRLPTRAVAAILMVVVVADLWLVDRHFFETTDAPQYMFAPDDVARFLMEQPKPFRVWVLPFGAQGRGAYWGHGDYLMHFDIDQAGGEHGNHIQRYGEYAGAGQQTYVDWHNYVQDAQQLADASTDTALAGPSVAPFLSAANIRYIVSTVGIQGLQEVFRGRAGVVYENPYALPRAYLVGNVMVPGPDADDLSIFRTPGFDPGRTAVLDAPLDETLPSGPLTGSASVDSYVPDRVVVSTDADHRALLVLADNYYPGWVATVDGVSTPVRRVNHTFRGVVVPEGAHQVVFAFRPPELRLGFTIYLATFGLLALYGLWLLRGRLTGTGRDHGTRAPGTA